MAVWKEKGIWCFKVTVKDSFGKPKQVKRQSQTWKRSDALKAERDFLGESATGSSMSFDNLFKQFMERQKKQIAETTYNLWKQRYHAQIEPFFGKIAIDKIDVKMIMAWQAYLLDSGLRNEYIISMQKIVKMVLNYAVVCNYIIKNPYMFAHVTNRSEVEKKIHVLPDNEFNDFMEFVERKEDIALYTLLYWGGLRIGEALALTLADFDTMNRIININKTLDPHTQKIAQPKTEQSKRSISVNKAVCDTLHRCIDTYATYADCSSERFIFGYDKPLMYATFRQRHKIYCDKSGIRFNIHALRHSNVSMLISLGAKPIQIAKRLGHSVTMVNDVYSHVFESDDKNLTDMQENIKRN